MADYPSPLRPQRAMSDMRYARMLRGTRANTDQTLRPPVSTAPAPAALPASTPSFLPPAGPSRPPFQSLLPESNPAATMVNLPAPAQTLRQPQRPVSPTPSTLGVGGSISDPENLIAQSLGTKQGMQGGVMATPTPNFNTTLPPNGAGAGRGVVNPTAVDPSGPAPTIQQTTLRPNGAGAGRGVVNPPVVNPDVTNPTGDIQYDKATNTFSNAAGRASLASQPSLGVKTTDTPAQVDATMSALQGRQPDYQLAQAKMNNVQSQGNMMRFQHGGTVPGEGKGDKIPAMYEPGEFVVSNAMLKKEPGLRSRLKQLQKKTLHAQGKTVAGAERESLRGPVLHAATSFSGDMEYDPITKTYNPASVSDVTPKSTWTAADEAAWEANNKTQTQYRYNTNRAIVPIEGTGRTGGYEFFDKPGSAGVVGGHGGGVGTSAPKSSGPWGATIDGLRNGGTGGAVPPDAPPAGNPWASTVDGLRGGAKHATAWDNVKASVKGMVPEGVNWKNPMAAAGGAGQTVGNAGAAATKGATELGKKAITRGLGPASNFLGVVGHTDAYGTDSPLSLKEQVQLGLTDLTRAGGTALGSAFGMGAGSVVPVAGTIAGGIAGGYAGDKYGRKLGNALFGGDDVLVKHKMDPDRNVIDVIQDAMKGDSKASATAAQTDAATPAAQAAANGTPTPAPAPSLRGSAFGPSEEDVAQRLANTRKDQALGDQMEQARLSQEAQGRGEQAAQGQTALAAQERLNTERMRQRAQSTLSSIMDTPAARAEKLAAVQTLKSLDDRATEDVKQRGESLRSAATNATSLRAHQITADASVLGHQLTAQAARANAQRTQLNSDRDYQLRREEFGNTKSKQQFEQNQAASKAYADQLGQKYVTEGPDGKMVVDTKAVAAHMAGAQEYLNQAAKNLQAKGQPEAAAQLLKDGYAGLDDKHKAVIDQGMAMKQLVAANKGIMPWAGTMVDSPNPADYAIVGVVGNSYKLRNGSEIPRSAVDGGWTARHPFSSIGTPQSSNFTSIGQQPY